MKIDHEKLHIKSYFKDDENVLLLNAQYIAPQKDENGNWTPDVLYLIYRDLDTKKKKVKTIIKPQVQTFITKPEYRHEYNTQRLYLESYKLDGFTCPYAKRTKFILDKIIESGEDKEYIKLYNEDRNSVFKWRHSYFADYDIRDFAAISYTNNITPSSYATSKAFLDIESDIYKATQEEQTNAETPINAVSVVIPYNANGEVFDHPKVFTFLLRNYIRYKDQEYLETHLDEFMDECNEEFENYDEPEIHINFYDDEIKMLKDLFKLLHMASPDLIAIWNMAYDVPTMIKRLEFLGENPADYFTDKEFQIPFYRYNYDMIYKNDIKNKSESFDCTSKIKWVDQMTNYAGIRKAKGDYGGNSLDNVAGIELNAQKRRFDKPTTTVINAAIEEYWNFVKYSINDVLLQYGIERRTQDLQVTFIQGLEGGTRMEKTLKQSQYLKNVYALEYFNLGIVPRNNKNLKPRGDNNTEPSLDDIILAGAVVGNPLLNDYTGIQIIGRRSNYFYKWIIDMDFKSMYPNIKITFNIGENTQEGRLIIEVQILPTAEENPLHDPKFLRGGKFIEDYITNDGWKTAKWLHIPDTYKVIIEYDKYRSTKKKKKTKIKSRRSLVS